ncbi:Glutamyl-tRNA amidotransferase subunit B, mitochondrial [Crucibulum laeve]|uniref:Glutamyl-tRNA(Gln) amidotransferase subunit B, mitochondrial n=1 Tax=Crucibulum laeve TaxID=68775 RepID=A0A5C3MEK3_9AGAR|nr:Glutamyl-tRNA amidotransferase subunit B, mitochondrial [Crucibulum laeve]
MHVAPRLFPDFLLNTSRYMLAVVRPCRLPFSLTTRLFHDVRVYKEDKRWPGWQVIIGIETHAQIKSRLKLFSESLTSHPDDPPNTHVSPFDAAFPGTLPKLNPKCVDLAIRTAVALQSDIQPRSSFDRKHYFYSDLPSGYQITQQYAPLALGGVLNIQLPDSSPVPVRIKQIQLEQDTAKSTFNPRNLTSSIDLNRAGTGLMEIVSEPDMRSPEEAGAYVRTLQAVLRAIGSSDGNMEQGSLRCDVNVSINRPGELPGTRCEIKNLNSVRFMMAAITHEIKRQQALLTSSSLATVPQETRGFDEHTFETFRLRSKEDAPDYRYMPDPNLGELRVSQSRIETIRSTLPELPWHTRTRLKSTYGISERDVEVLLSVDSGREVQFDGDEGDGGRGAVAYFDRLVAGNGQINEDGKKKKGRDPKVAVNWMTHELLGQLAARNESFKDNTLTSGQLGELIDLVTGRIITGTSAKLLLRHLLAKPSSERVLKIAEDLQLTALSPSSSSCSSSSSSQTAEDPLFPLCKEAIAALPSEVAAVRAGNKNVLHKIVGHVMKGSRGRADAKRVREVVEGLIMGEGKQ